MLPQGYQTDKVLQVETNLDDISPELVGHVIGRLFEASALDVWVTPIQMKKQRPGMLLSLLCLPEALDALTEILFVHTSAFGIRLTEVTRLKLRRDFISVETPYGPVSVKRGFRADHLLQIAPEFESCRQAAEQHAVPLQEVYLAARVAAHRFGTSLLH